MGYFSPSQITRYKAGDKVSAARMNALEQQVEQLLRMVVSNGVYLPSTGPVTRRAIGGGGGTQVRLAKAQEAAQGDEFISVKLLDSAGAVTGDAFDAEGLMPDGGTALNACLPTIVTDDILPVFKANDGDWYIDDLFHAASGRTIRKAYCKTAAGAGTTLTCYLDTDATGDEVTVNFSIANGSDLDEAIPRLADGTLIFVTQIGATWYCLTTFQGSEDCVCEAP